MQNVKKYNRRLLYVGSKKVHEDRLVAISADRITAPTDGFN